MKEKEKRIVEEAMKLFAKKGFSSTSVQEIADEAGISKGAFYLYFKSKEELMISIFKYYYERINRKVRAIEEEGLDPKEKFIKQLYVQLEEIKKHKDFILMHTREQTVPFNKDIEMIILKMRAESFLLYKKALTDIYGERVSPFIWDLIISIQGIFQSYLGVMLFDTEKLDTKQIAAFIFNRTEDIVHGLEKSQEPAIIESDKMERLLNLYHKEKISDQQDLIKMIHETKNSFMNHPDQERIQVTLDVIVEEIQNDSPRIPVIQGMLANLSGYSVLEPLKQQIESYFQI
ncbi:MAG TPA: TetR/AcrR family transcriptional regulator [Bacillus sp. (in: firmicutes)]|uniref:TetR/AcrR family transcriptional regulator n=1 Tax=Bacillus litorisediminis TaxID=2922713 RepID=UPI001FAC6BDD|nr:TetR/AcrR family transcriptional regulator [Bacillus litorisediminis]HWO77063.1 TetR/AcrR family transcriptional regulator [Bacillus sp. (in: firmicutes)]